MLKNKKGFTLIELLIVITIIGILAVAFLPSLLGAPAKARDTQRIADVQKIAGVMTNKMLTSGNINGGCAKGDAVTGVIESAADFGGAYPKDPLQTNGPTSGCAGGYLIVPGDRSQSGNLYSFGVFAKLENSGGNIDCASVSGLGTSATTLSISAGTGKGCYGVLIQ